MKKRLDYYKASPEATKGLIELEIYAKKCGIETSLYELVKTRASQINGCAYCLDMHTKDARKAGETEQRLYGLSAWREAPYYSDRERAALAWTEAVTLIHKHQVTDELYEEALKNFSEKELVDLTMIINAINSWNRLAIAFHVEAGTYQPA
ncbi:MAG: carboxymuconolactone decarboxylase family protein [Crocinitomicaceae bacterium]|nr:carboxymuconolactone decarboxylase family protein [Crocinitomicaceae bacterium]